MAGRLTTRSIPSQRGRVAIVTGANSGIGFETAGALAAAGAKTVLACRNDERAAAACAEVVLRHPGADVEVLRLDLGDLAQIAAAAAEAKERFGPIHLCVNNAGLLGRSRSVTADGFETTFGVNHLGHFAWTADLLPAILAAPDGRVVTVSSLAHLQTSMNWDDLMGEQTSSQPSPTGAPSWRTCCTASSFNADCPHPAYPARRTRSPSPRIRGSPLLPSGKTRPGPG